MKTSKPLHTLPHVQAMTNDEPEILNDVKFGDGYTHGSYYDSDMKVPETSMDTGWFIS